MVGDKECDIELADRVGVKGYLVLTGHGEKTLALLDERGTRENYRVVKTLLEMANDLPTPEGVTK